MIIQNEFPFIAKVDVCSPIYFVCRDSEILAEFKQNKKRKERNDNVYNKKACIFMGQFTLGIEKFFKVVIHIPAVVIKREFIILLDVSWGN